jgi:hypothetical protein
MNDAEQHPERRAPGGGLGSLLAWFGDIFVLPSFFVVWLATLAVPFLLPSFVSGVWPHRLTAPWVGLAVAVPACLWAARAGARFVLRVFPPRADGRRRFGLALLCSLLAVFLTFGTLREGLEQIVSESTGQSLLQHPDLYMLAPGVAWTMAFMFLAARYLRGCVAGRDYVLFLRTFLGFSDRAMMATLFSSIGARRKVVVVTTPRSNAASWDPFLVSLRGNPVHVPWARIPEFLTAKNEDWQRPVGELIERSSVVVVDVSEMTPGVADEVAMVQHGKSPEQVVWLFEGSQVDAERFVASLAGADWVRPERIVGYERSFAAAVPNLALGCGVAFFALAFIPIFAAFMAGGMEPVVDANIPKTLGRLFGMACPATALILAVFLRKAVDRSARGKLRRLLRSRA